MVFKDFTIAIGNFIRYDELLKRKAGRTIVFILFWVLIFSIGIIVVPSIRMYGRITESLMEELPEFEATQYGLTVEEPFEFKFAGMLFLATNDKICTEEDFGDSIQAVVMDKEKILVRNWGQTVMFKYDELDFNHVGYSIKKSNLPDYKPYYITFVAMFDFFMYIGLLFSYLMTSIFVALICNLINTFMKKRMKFDEILKMSFYSRTLPLLLTAFLALANIKMNSVISYIISIAIVVLSLKNIQDGFGELADNEEIQ